MSSDLPLDTHTPAHGHFCIVVPDLEFYTVILVIFCSARRECQGIIWKESELRCQNHLLRCSDLPLDTHTPAHDYFCIVVPDLEFYTVILVIFCSARRECQGII